MPIDSQDIMNGVCFDKSSIGGWGGGVGGGGGEHAYPQ